MFRDLKSWCKTKSILYQECYGIRVHDRWFGTAPPPDDDNGPGRIVRLGGKAWRELLRDAQIYCDRYYNKALQIFLLNS